MPHKMTPGSREKHSDDNFRDDSSPKKFAANDVTTSNKPTYGYSESGEFTQTGGKPRPKWLKPLSGYNANERKQLIKSGTIPQNKPTGGGSSAYLLKGNTQMRNFIESSNQRSRK